MMQRSVSAMLLLAGCMVSPVARNPGFVAAKAPGPTAALEVVACHDGTAMGSSTQVAAIYADRVRTTPRSLNNDSAHMVCAYVHEGSLRSFAVNPSLRLIVQQASTSLGAQSLFIPVFESERFCRHRTDTVTDANGDLVGSVESNQMTCGDSPQLNIYGLLFAGNGDLLWTARPSHAVRRNQPSDIDNGFLEVLAEVPADFATLSPTPEQASQ
jgi:hypothetical protein